MKAGISQIFHSCSTLNISKLEIATEKKEKIKFIGYAVIEGVALVALFYLNPKIGFAGFLAGVLEKDSLSKYIGRISSACTSLCKSNNTMIGFGAFLYLSLPMTLATGAFFGWANLATRI